jgi:hypothetical protein
VYGEEFGAEGRFDPDGISPLKQILAEQPVYQLSLFSQDDEHSSGNLRCEIFDEERFRGNRYAYIQFPLSRVEGLTGSALFAFVSSLLSALDQIGSLDYAMITIMESSLPATYFREAFSEDLSDEEALNLATWISQSKSCKTKLRGLYWGNLLGPGHLSQIADRSTFMNRLAALVGSQRMTHIRRDMLFFILPSSDVTSDPIVSSVAALLNEHHLLMQPDDRAREIFRRILR